MRGSIRVGTLAGIRIAINYGWFIILPLTALSLALGWFPSAIQGRGTETYLILGIIGAILLFFSVLAHDLAHVLMARACGLPVRRITLFVFGGFSNLESAPRSAGTEILIATAAPVVSLALGVISWLAAFLVSGFNEMLASMLTYVAAANVLLGLFNLIPGFPLDGGRVLRSMIWKATGNLRRATHWAARFAQLIALVVILGAVWQMLRGNLLVGIWIGFIGWFLLTAARSADISVARENVLRSVRVADVMRPVTLSAPPRMSLQELVEHYLPPGIRTVPVAQGDRLVGLIRLADVERIPRNLWDEMVVGNVMIPLPRLRAVSPEQSLSEVLPLMVGQDINQWPVAWHGQVVGMISREAITRYVDAQRALEAESGGQRDVDWTPTQPLA